MQEQELWSWLGIIQARWLNLIDYYASQVTMILTDKYASQMTMILTDNYANQMTMIVIEYHASPMTCLDRNYAGLLRSQSCII